MIRPSLWLTNTVQGCCVEPCSWERLVGHRGGRALGRLTLSVARPHTRALVSQSGNAWAG